MADLAAQVSLYPLRSARIRPAIEQSLAILRASGCDVQAGSMSTIIRGDDEALFRALRAAFTAAAHEAQEVVMVVTVSNACPLPRSSPGDTEERA